MGLRLSIAAVVVVGMFATLLVRLWSLQVLQGRRLNAASEQTTTRAVVTPAPRGEILARGGQALARDAFEWVVTVETTPGAQGARIADPAVKRRLVALIPGLSVKGIDADLTSNQFSPYQPIPVAFDVPPSAVLYIEQHESEFPGVIAQQESVRDYPYVGVATQTLGYVRQITAPELAELRATATTRARSSARPGSRSSTSSTCRVSPGWSPRRSIRRVRSCGRCRRSPPSPAARSC